MLMNNTQFHYLTLNNLIKSRGKSNLVDKNQDYQKSLRKYLRSLSIYTEGHSHAMCCSTKMKEMKYFTVPNPSNKIIME